MPIQQMIDSVAASGGIDPQIAEKTAGTILSVIRHEAGTQADRLFAAMPDAAELAQRFDVMAPTAAGGGLLSSIGSLFGQAAGEKIGALVNGVQTLRASGLTTAQIKQAGSAVIAYAEQTAGPGAVKALVDAAPGLAGHFGL